MWRRRGARSVTSVGESGGAAESGADLADAAECAEAAEPGWSRLARRVPGSGGVPPLSGSEARTGTAASDAAVDRISRMLVLRVSMPEDRESAKDCTSVSRRRICASENLSSPSSVLRRAARARS